VIHHLTVDTTTAKGTLKPVSDTICIWDFRDFDDGVFGTNCPDGWYKEQYPFVNYVIIMTFTGGRGYNEWYTEDENGIPRYDFTVPIRVLKNVLRQKVKPIVVIGGTPSALSVAPEDGGDSCEWGNRGRPSDYGKYYDYILAFGQTLMANFGAAEIKTWKFRVGTEMDNLSWWVDSEEEYYKLYDFTADALEKAFGRENLYIAPTNLLFVENWPSMLAHCARGLNACTGLIGAPCDFYSISYYTDAPALGDLRGKIELMKTRVAEVKELNIQEINVGEGQFLYDGTPFGANQPHRLKMAQVGTEHGASYQAALFALCQESDLSSFANWAYNCDFKHTNEPMLRTPAFHAANLLSQIHGNLLESSGTVSWDGGQVGVCAAIDQNTVYAAIFYHGEEWEGEQQELSLCVNGLPWESLRVTKYIVDRCHSNFYTQWLADSKEITRMETPVDIGVLGSFVETEVSMTLSEQDREFWRAKKAKYADISSNPFSTITIETTQNGAWTAHCQIDGHGLVMFKLEPQE